MERETIIDLITAFFDPLVESAQSSEKAVALVRELGYEPPASAGAFTDLAVPLETLYTLLEELELLDEVADRAEYIDKATEIFKVVIEVLAAITSCADALASDVEWAAVFNDADSIKEFVSRLFDYLVIGLLKREYEPIYRGLLLIGLVKETDVDHSSDPYRVSHKLLEVQWDQVPGMITNSIEVLKELYGWGTDLIDYALLFSRLRYFALSLGVLSYLDAPHEAAAAAFDGLVAVDGLSVIDEPESEILRIPFYPGDDEDAVGCEVYPLVEAGGGNGNVIAFGIGFYLSPGIEHTLDLTDDVHLELSVQSELDTGFGIIIRPNEPPQFVSSLFQNGPVSFIDSQIVNVRLNFTFEPSFGKLVSLRAAEGSRFEIGSGSLALGLEKMKSSRFFIEGDLKDVLIELKTEGADGFISKLLPAEGITANFDFGVGFSSDSGFTFRGSGSVEVTIPIHEKIGPIKIETIYLAINIDGNIEIILAISAGANIGPVSASIERIGIVLPIQFPSEGDGNLGPLDVKTPCFLPPQGAGFAIDGEVVVGGGFLDFDDQNRRYSGILALQLSDIGITAIGLITTRMPDGSDGFSMLVSICITFDPPIQIYMGFTLAGVGGLIGVNRTMETEVLQEGVKKGTIDSILFPDPASVIANASRIISDMRSVFPPEEGRFVIGPMIRIGWGTPTIISGDIGIFLEVPEPVRIALMGQVEMALPDPENETVGIHIDILGILDTKKKELSFQASIYGSSFRAFKLHGDCAFFLRWGSNQEFALSIGGFHPSFTPPPPRIIFSDLKRLGVTINYGPVVQLQCAGYMALTPNSLQFGARVEIFVGVEEVDAGISGFLSFDGLIYFSPFSFEVNMGGGLAISVGPVTLADIRVSQTLAGPTPWNIRGTATVKILFVDVDCGFNITWGQGNPAIQEAVNPWPRLKEAFERAESWGSRLPASASMVEALRQIEEEQVASTDVGDEAVPAPIVVHPAGTLEVRQNVVPLEMTLDKFGNAPVCEFNRFRIDDIHTKELDSLDLTSVDEFFSRGQYEDLTNDQRLSTPSYEKMPGGAETGSSNCIKFTGDGYSQKVGYESIVIKSDRTAETIDEAGTLEWSKKGQILASGNAARRCALRNRGKAKFTARGQSMVETQEENYFIVDCDSLQTIDVDSLVDAPESGFNRTQADQALDQQVALHPDQAGKLMVVPEYEVEELV